MHVMYILRPFCFHEVARGIGINFTQPFGSGPHLQVDAVDRNLLRALRKNGNLSSSSVRQYFPPIMLLLSFPFLSLPSFLLPRLVVGRSVVLHSGGGGGKTALVRDELVLPLLNRCAMQLGS